MFPPTCAAALKSDSSVVSRKYLGTDRSDFASEQGGAKGAVPKSMNYGLSRKQVQQFHDDGFLIVRNLLPPEAYQPLVGELVAEVDELTNEAVTDGLLDPADTFPEEPFPTRLAMVSKACREPKRIWRKFQGKRHKTAGMFALRTHPSILDATESLIGPEIYAHPQSNLRAKMPDEEATVVPWHQDLAYLVPEDAGETLFINFWIPLVEATSDNGCLQVIRGSHRFGLLPHNFRTAFFHGIAETNLPEGEVVTCEVFVGDVLITMERVIHRSTPHTRRTVRWSLDVRYSRTGLPTGRKHIPGFVARSRDDPASVAKSHHDWLRIFEEAGIDPIRN